MTLPLIVQARMGSTRLPGKMLRVVRDKTVLSYVIERLDGCRLCDPIMVATSDRADDDPLAQACDDLGVPCFRGALEDVAGRYLALARARGLEAFVRISGDSPLIDAGIVDRAVHLFESAGCDVASNVVVRSFPKGQSVEVIRTAALAQAAEAMEDPQDREHVTPYLYRHPERFDIVGFEHPDSLGDLRLCIDTPDDLARFEAIAAAMEAPHTSYDLGAVLSLVQRHGIEPR